METQRSLCGAQNCHPLNAQMPLSSDYKELRPTSSERLRLGGMILAPAAYL